MIRILNIQFDKFDGSARTRFVETVLDGDGEVIDQHELKHRPTSVMFDEVRECGCGGNGLPHMAFCTRSKRVFGHKLEKQVSPASRRSDGCICHSDGTGLAANEHCPVHPGASL